jgi:hypothetical protein
LDLSFYSAVLNMTLEESADFRRNLLSPQFQNQSASSKKVCCEKFLVKQNFL